MQVVWRKFSGVWLKDTDRGSDDQKDTFIYTDIGVDVDRWVKLPNGTFARRRRNCLHSPS